MNIAIAFGAGGLSMTLFIGPDGIVRHLEIRGMDAAVIQAGIARAR